MRKFNLLLLAGLVLGEKLCPDFCTCQNEKAKCQGIMAWNRKPVFAENIKILDLSNNRIGDLDLAHVHGLETIIFDDSKLLESPALSLPSGLIKLSLRGCQLSEVPKLGGATGSIRELDLSKNRFRRVGSLEFANWGKLEHLDLSYNRIQRKLSRSRKESALELHLPATLTSLNLDGNQIRELRFGVFNKLKKLEELSVKNNRLLKIDGDQVLAANNALRSFNLAENELKEFPQFFLKHQSKLRHLDLSGNSLGVSGLSLALYIQGSRLETLNLSRNALEEITDDILYRQDNLLSLDLSWNNISHLAADRLDGPWKYTRQLRTLNVSGNKIQRLETAAFSQLGNLEELDLAGNEIKIIFPSSFKGLNKLKSLSLRGNVLTNELRNIADSIVDLSSVETIDLRQNELRRITRSTFVHLTRVTSIDLRENPLTEIDFEAFDEKSLIALKINSDSFLCDCNLIWFLKQLRDRNAQSSSSVCHHPPKFLGSNLVDLDLDTLTCDDNPKPEVISGPMDVSVEIGGDAKFSCSVKTTEISSLQIEWLYQESHDTNEVIRLLPDRSFVNINTPNLDTLVGSVVESTLTMRSLEVTRDQFPEGFITCQVRNRYGSTSSDAAELSMFQYPGFAKKPKNQTVALGDDVRLTCDAIGYPAPLVSWGFPKSPESYKGRIQVTKDGRVVTIENIREDDSGKYTCSASNSADNVSLDVFVQMAPSQCLVEFHRQVDYQTGIDAVLKCHHPKVYPSLSTEWYFNNSLLAPSGRHNFVDDGSILVISSTEIGDAGYYQCRIFNDLGQTTVITKLGVTPSGFLSEAPVWLWISAVAILAILMTSLIWLGVFCYSRRHQDSEFGTNSTNLPMPLERHLEDQQKSAARLASNRAQGVISWGSEYHQTPTPVLQTSSQDSDNTSTMYHQVRPTGFGNPSPFLIIPPSPQAGTAQHPYAPPIGLSSVPLSNHWAPRAATMPDLDLGYQNSPSHQQLLMPPPPPPTPGGLFNHQFTQQPRSIHQLHLGDAPQFSAPGPDRMRHRNRNHNRNHGMRSDTRSLRDLPRKTLLPPNG